MSPLKHVPPPVDSEYHWRRIMNLAYGAGEDELFRWLRTVRDEVCREKTKRRGRAA